MWMSKTMRRRPWWVKPLFFLCVTAVSVGVLVCIWKFNWSAGKEEPKLPDAPAHPLKKPTAKGGISGAEVKKHLSGLAEDDVVIIASYDFLTEGEMLNPGYLVYPLSMDLTRRYIVIEETAYDLTGVNYGAVLSDNVLKTVSAEGGGLYTQCGLMTEDDIGEYINAEGAVQTIVRKRKFHPWEQDAMSIDDDERFFKETVYGPDFKEIGVFYYPCY